jgi:hypothetical protein
MAIMESGNATISTASDALFIIFIKFSSSDSHLSPHCMMFPGRERRVAANPPFSITHESAVD